MVYIKIFQHCKGFVFLSGSAPDVVACNLDSWFTGRAVSSDRVLSAVMGYLAGDSSRGACIINANVFGLAAC